MLDEILAMQSVSAGASAYDILGNIVISFILGGLISMTYQKTSNKGGYSSSLAVTLIMVPMVIGMIIFLIGNNVARAFSLAGAFSIIRFRSAPGDPKDITYVLFAMAAGLATGVGFYVYGAIFSVVLCLLMFILHRIDFGESTSTEKILKITVPENLSFEGVFNEILDIYSDDYSLSKIKTSELGSLYQLEYKVNLKDEGKIKELMDELRARNGNLTIAIFSQEQVA